MAAFDMFHIAPQEEFSIYSLAGTLDWQIEYTVNYAYVPFAFKYSVTLTILYYH
jgi:hypothetical protein